MENIDIIKNITERTNGDIYLGVVGAVRTGKSTFINKIDNKLNLETNEISKVLGRGKHTTRMVSLYKEDGFFISDTPGFSSLSLENISFEDLNNAFVEFSNFKCKYSDCNHINTQGCNIENNKEIELEDIAKASILKTFEVFRVDDNKNIFFINKQKLINLKG